ncbi:Protein-glutamate methylesterase/protein-glutamine glutaminase [Streptomyces alboniger]
MSDAALISLLIVDDHPVVRDGLRGMFESAPGFAVLGEAANGVEALESATVLDPDVILVDLRMPGGGESRRSPSWPAACAGSGSRSPTRSTRR